jgi:hypothetical protein
MAQTYLYQDARDLFYTLTGTTDDDTENILIGQQVLSDAVNDLLRNAEVRTAMLLYPFWVQGKCPAVETLVTTTQWTGTGSQTAFTLPDDLYMPIAGYLINSDNSHCLLSFESVDILNRASINPFYEPSTGTHPYAYVPVYTEGGSLKFVTAPATTVTNGIILSYYKLPKSPSGANSDLHASLLELTVYNMIAMYRLIDGDDMDVALAQHVMARMQELAQAINQALGFNPFKVL